MKRLFISQPMRDKLLSVRGDTTYKNVTEKKGRKTWNF